MPSASPGCSMLNWNKCLDFSECLRQWSLNVDGQRKGGGEQIDELSGAASFTENECYLVFSPISVLVFFLQILAWPEIFTRRITTEKEGRACCLSAGCLQSRWKMACSLQCLMFGMRTHHSYTHAQACGCTIEPALVQMAGRIFQKCLQITMCTHTLKHTHTHTFAFCVWTCISCPLSSLSMLWHQNLQNHHNVLAPSWFQRIGEQYLYYTFIYASLQWNLSLQSCHIFLSGAILLYKNMFTSSHAIFCFPTQNVPWVRP